MGLVTVCGKLQEQHIGHRTWMDELEDVIRGLPRNTWGKAFSVANELREESSREFALRRLHDPIWSDVAPPEDQDGFMARVQAGIDELFQESPEEEDARKRRIDEWQLERMQARERRTEEYYKAEYGARQLARKDEEERLIMALHELEAKGDRGPEHSSLMKELRDLYRVDGPSQRKAALFKPVGKPAVVGPLTAEQIEEVKGMPCAA